MLWARWIRSETLCWSTGRLACLGVVAIAGVSQAVALDVSFMRQADVRSNMVGHAMKGYYRGGERWIDDYALDGGIKYSDARNAWTGKWSFQNDVFCTYYNGGVDGGCYLVRQASRNCFEYVVVPNDWSQSDVPAGASRDWFARGWRSEDPSTCEDPLLS